VKRLKKHELKQLNLKLDYRGDQQLHDSIIVKLLNLGFSKDTRKVLRAKPDFFIFTEKGRFYTAYNNWVYAEKFTLITLDELYNLHPYVPPSTMITLSDGREVELPEKVYGDLMRYFK
jgi:hypothetical protein